MNEIPNLTDNEKEEITGMVSKSRAKLFSTSTGIWSFSILLRS